MATASKRLGPLAVVCLTALGCTPHATQSPNRQLGITLANIEGEQVELVPRSPDDVFVLAFWATWCQPCQSELAKLDAMYRDHPNANFQLFAVSIDGPDSVPQVTSWARREQYTFEVLLDQETRLLGRYNQRGGIPFYVVLDAKGSILRAHAGYVDGDIAELARFLDDRPAVQ